MNIPRFYPYICHECDHLMEVEFEPEIAPRTYGPPEDCDPGAPERCDPEECPECGAEIDMEQFADY